LINRSVRNGWLLQTQRAYRTIKQNPTAANIFRVCNKVIEECDQALAWLQTDDNSNKPFPFTIFTPHHATTASGTRCFDPKYLSDLGLKVPDEPALFLGGQPMSEASTGGIAAPPPAMAPPPATVPPSIMDPPMATVPPQAMDPLGVTVLPLIVVSNTPPETMEYSPLLPADAAVCGCYHYHHYRELADSAHMTLDHFSKYAATVDTWQILYKTDAESRLKIYYGREQCPPGCLDWPNKNWSLRQYKVFYKQLFKVFFVETVQDLGAADSFFQIESSGACPEAAAFFNVIYHTDIHKNKGFLEDVHFMHYGLHVLFENNSEHEMSHMSTSPSIHGIMVLDRLKIFAAYIYSNRFD